MKSFGDYAAANHSFHQDVYSSGYGVKYPKGHIIRSYHRVLKHELGITGSNGENLLDFGCGTGTHSVFFRELGFNVYGTDSDAIAIKKCQLLMPDHSDRFRVSDLNPTEAQLDFGIRYDVVLSNQVLYYFDDADLSSVVNLFGRLLKPGGVFIATMMSDQHHFYSKAVHQKGSISRVKVSGRVNNEMFINFTRSEADLKAKFCIFEPLHIGFYDALIREDEGRTHHYLFIGVKP